MKKLKILYIEDNPTDFEMVKAILEEEGVLKEIIRIEKREELYEELDRFNPDAVLSDFNLPVFHGMEALKIMKSKYPDIPIIMVTGNLSDEIAVDLIKKGAWDYVLKENIIRLVPSILSALEKKSMREERVRAGESLKESENNYRLLAESSPYGIIVHSEGEILYCNRAARKIVSVEENIELIGLNLFDYIHPEFKNEVIKRVRALYKGDNFPGPIEVKYISPDGKDLFLEIAASSIIYKGKPAAQVIFSDINERKKAEQELLDARNTAIESDRLKTVFLENLSHEIRTPLNGIIGFASLLKIKELSENDKDNYIGVIEESGNQLLSIIDDLIEISRIEAGEIELRYEVFNLNLLLDELFVFFNAGARYKEKPILLNMVKARKDSVAIIESDKYRIKQVLMNLLTNAYKFTGEGTIEFGYRIEKELIRFYVKDTGIGISGEEQEVIFDRFRQGDDSATRKYGGNGLGLTISKAIAIAMHGGVSVDSVPDKGSVFYFFIPYKAAFNKKEQEISISKSNRSVNDFTGKKIIIAEDEMTNFTLLNHLLSKTGAQLSHARTGIEVLKYMESEENFDAILLDIKMPEMDGYETITELRKKGFKIPVIAQTAYAMQSDIRKILNAGCDDCITKPIDAEKLFKLLNRLL